MIKLLEDLINQAIDHGGDAGGAYGSNPKAVEIAVYRLLKAMRYPKEVYVEWHNDYVQLVETDTVPMYDTDMKWLIL